MTYTDSARLLRNRSAGTPGLQVSRWRRSAAAVVAAAAAAMSPLSAAGASSAVPEIAGVAHWGAVFEASGNTDQLYSPLRLPLPGPAVEVATSNSDEYALLANGEVWAWGLDAFGQLGNGTTQASPNTAVQVSFPPGVKIAFLPTDAMPRDTGLAVDTQGNVWGWGYATGALCESRSVVHLVPTELPFRDVTALAGAGDHALYDAAGTVYACGGNGYGDLGDNGTARSSKPVRVDLPAGIGVKTLVAAYMDSGALLDNGQYYDWGYNAQGQLGDGTRTPSDLPVAVRLPGPVSQVVQGGSDVGNGQTLVQLSNGSLWSWGDGADGQLGTGRLSDESSPVPFSPPTGVTFAALATGAVTSYAISTAGGVYAWGGGALGQLGDGRRHDTATPELVETGASQISSTANVVDTLGAGPAATQLMR